LPKEAKIRPRNQAYQLHRAGDLERYLRDTGAGAGSAASSFGVMLERARILNETEIACPACRRRHRRAVARMAARTNGRGAALLAECGVSQYDLRAIIQSQRKPCRQCDDVGTVWIRITRGMLENRGITRWPTGSSKHGRQPDTVSGSAEQDRVDMGRIGNALEALRHRSPVAAMAITAFWGPDGGNQTVIWEYTDPGQTLLEHKPGKGPARVFFEAEQRRRATGHTDHVRDRLCDRAERAAGEVLEMAVRLWNELVPDEMPREKRHKASIQEEARQELKRVAS